ncbi:SdrD B-like domain-containing protein [Streptomyces graminilatus]|uniref:SdrD B-like domain-containing protein n=1 Tax=Streptomyces graminilatus TaxID=1464070 RepID=UPI00099E39F6|nr:SdrD B-like domain-containing protein [Streptomyces graminilatus]
MFRAEPGTAASRRRLHGAPPGRRRRLAGLTGLSLALVATGSPAVAATGLGPLAATTRAAATSDGTLTVRVVTEVNANGAYDSVLEPGLAGVKVTLTDDAGQIRTATTGSDGTATFAATAELTGGRYRVQVTNPDPDNLSPAVAGLGSGADVIRSNTGFVDVSGGTNVTYTTGFWEPGVYCQENPSLVTCNLAKGDAPGTYKGLVSLGGDFNNSYGGSSTQLTDNTKQQAVFGIGVDRTGNKYLGTLVKRHTAYGPAGNTNTIYRQFGTAKSVDTFVTLPGTLTAHDTTGNWLHDDAVYGRVGREGIGDVDVSGDGRTLYAVNLNDSKLYSVGILGSGDSARPGSQSAYDIPRPQACVGQWHPYGIGVRGKRVLVGGVCGAETTVTSDLKWGDPGQLSAHVYEFKGGAFSEIFTHALNYPRGCAYRFTGQPGANYRCTKPSTVGQVMSGEWEAWNERVPGHEEHNFISAPQPILSNIEIADNGDLVLGYRDRFGDMTGSATYAYNSTAEPLVTGIAAGDVLRACKSGTTYTLENNGSCGALTGNLAGNGEGPGGGEFYNDSTTLGDAVHDQIGEGGLALQPYRDKLFSTVYDPYNAYEQGVRRWTADSGEREGNFIVQTTWGSPTAVLQNLFGKANGLADLELVCDQAPVQIGNRVWYDSNGNGVQDPSEPPVAGVVVRLTSTDGRELTATTDANGEYYLGTKDGLTPNTSYAATFDYSGINPSTLPGSPTLSEVKWTQQGAGSDRALDSNVDPAGRTTVDVGDPGYVDHTIDAGLVGPVNKLGDYVWYDPDGNGIQDRGEPPAPGVTVNLYNGDGDLLKTTKTDASGKYLFDELADGSYKVCFVKPAGYAWTRRNAGADGDDSVADTATGCSPVVTLGPGNRQDLTLDAGLVELNRLGDIVWYDTNGNGIQDPGEPGAKDVPVELIAPATGDVIRTTKTDASGKYLFADLPDGRYKVCFRGPSGYLWTRQDAGRAGDDSVVGPATGCSPVVTLGPGNRQDLTLDAGLVKELGLTVVKTDKKTGKALHGAVFQLWSDSNGKSGLQRTGAGKDRMVGDCVTGRTGECYFDGVRIGTYYLVEKDVPEGYVLPDNPVFGPYRLTLANGTGAEGLIVKIANKRGEPCKGKKC